MSKLCVAFGLIVSWAFAEIAFKAISSINGQDRMPRGCARDEEVVL